MVKAKGPSTSISEAKRGFSCKYFGYLSFPNACGSFLLFFLSRCSPSISEVETAEASMHQRFKNGIAKKGILLLVKFI
jgi:hypothetical protein